MSTTIKVVSLPKRSSTTATDVTVTAPTSGTGWVAVGAIPFNDAQGAAAAVVFDNTVLNSVSACKEVTPTANTTVTKRFVFASASTLTKLGLWALTAPASTGGTVLFTAKKNGSTTVLNAANFDAETLTSATTNFFTLTGTAADLAFAAGDYLELKIVSNNADMTGMAEGEVCLEYTKI